MPVSRKAHHCQLLATPFSRTRLVTRFGVSVLKVVATMDTPTSHQGAERPEVKNSAVLLPARRARTTAGMKDTTILAMTMSQSRGTNRMRAPAKIREGAKVAGTRCPKVTPELGVRFPVAARLAIPYLPAHDCHGDPAPRLPTPGPSPRPRRAPPGSGCPGPFLRRAVPGGGQDHRHFLPPDLPVQAGQAGEPGILRDPRRRRRRRVPALPPLQAAGAGRGAPRVGAPGPGGARRRADPAAHRREAGQAGRGPRHRTALLPWEIRHDAPRLYPGPAARIRARPAAGRLGRFTGGLRQRVRFGEWISRRLQEVVRRHAERGPRHRADRRHHPAKSARPPARGRDRAWALHAGVRRPGEAPPPGGRSVPLLRTAGDPGAEPTHRRNRAGAE